MGKDGWGGLQKSGFDRILVAVSVMADVNMCYTVSVSMCVCVCVCVCLCVCV